MDQVLAAAGSEQRSESQMETEVTNHSGAPGRWIFVEAYYNLPGIWESEWVEYYPATNLDRLRSELKSHIEHQLDLFSESEYEDHFSAAEYGNPEEFITADELPLFRAALPKSGQQLPLDELHPRDQLKGYRAVLLNRVANGDWAALQSAVYRFNWLIEAAIEGVDDRDARSYIEIKTEKDFAPSFIGSLLASIDRLQEPRRRYDHYSEFIGERFQPLKPLLEILRPSVSHPAWPSSDLALGRFLLIVDYFKVVSDEYSNFQG
jgi:hypothetical protein